MNRGTVCSCASDSRGFTLQSCDLLGYVDGRHFHGIIFSQLIFCFCFPVHRFSPSFLSIVSWHHKETNKAHLSTGTASTGLPGESLLSDPGDDTWCRLQIWGSLECPFLWHAVFQSHACAPTFRSTMISTHCTACSRSSSDPLPAGRIHMGFLFLCRVAFDIPPLLG